MCACVGGAASPGCNLIGCSAQSAGAGGQQPVYKTTPLIGLGLLQKEELLCCPRW